MSWEPVEDDGWCTWALALGVVGWIDEPAGRSAKALADQVDLLERRRQQLSSEVSAAVEDGLAKGREAAREEVRALAAAFRADRAALVGRAASAVLDVAEAFVGQALALDPGLATSSVERALAEDDSRRPVRVLVPPALVSLVRDLVEPGCVVEASNRLSIGDAVVEYRDGKVDRRVSSLLADWAPEVAAHLEDGDED